MKLRNFLKLWSKNYRRYENSVGMCHTLKSVKLSKNTSKISIFTAYKTKIGQNGLFWHFQASISCYKMQFSSRIFIELWSKNYGIYENCLGMCHTLKSLKPVKSIGKRDIFTVYNAKMGQNGYFSHFQVVYPVIQCNVASVTWSRYGEKIMRDIKTMLACVTH